MKKGIHFRVFISFALFVVLIVNIFVGFFYFIIIKNFSKNVKQSLENEYSIIKTFIDLTPNSSIFSLPKIELEKINNLGFYLYIGKNDFELQKKYKFGFKENTSEIIFRGDYNGYNIIIGKKLTEVNIIKKDFLKLILFLNIFLVFASIVFSFLITKYSLNPLKKLALFLENYKKENKLLQNNYGNSDIGKLTNSINHFIEKNKEITDSQLTFIQDTSHELKTPLMQIESNIELLEDKIKDEKIKEKLNQIKTSSENINTIITNLAFILKGEEIPQKKEEINMFDYFSSLIKKYNQSLTKKGDIKIINNYDLILENNSYYLDRIFGNLIENAIHYCNTNLEIKIEINKDNITIIDNGIGINKQEQTKIFNRFYRNKNSNIYNNSGNGLGLVIVKKIANMFGWRIILESEKGKGTKFMIIVK